MNTILIERLTYLFEAKKDDFEKLFISEIGNQNNLTPTANDEVARETNQIEDEEEAEKESLGVANDFTEAEIVDLVTELEKTHNNPQASEGLAKLYSKLLPMLERSALNGIRKHITVNSHPEQLKLTPQDVVNDVFSRIGTKKIGTMGSPLLGLYRLLVAQSKRWTKGGSSKASTTPGGASIERLFKTLLSVVNKNAQGILKREKSKLTGKEISLNDLVDTPSEEDLMLRMSKIGLDHKSVNVIQQQIGSYITSLKKATTKGDNYESLLSQFKYRIADLIFGPVDQPLHRLQKHGLISLKPNKAGMGLKKNTISKIIQGMPDDKKLSELANSVLEAKKKGSATEETIKDFIKKQIHDVWAEIRKLLGEPSLALTRELFPGDKIVMSLPGGDPWTVKLPPRLKAPEEVYKPIFAPKELEIIPYTKADKPKFIELLRSMKTPEEVYAAIRDWKLSGLPDISNPKPDKEGNKRDILIPAVKSKVTGSPMNIYNVFRQVKIKAGDVDAGGRAKKQLGKDSKKGLPVSDPERALGLSGSGKRVDTGTFINYLKSLLNKQDIVRAVREWLLNRRSALKEIRTINKEIKELVNKIKKKPSKESQQELAKLEFSKKRIAVEWPLKDSKTGQPIDNLATDYVGVVSLFDIEKWLNKRGLLKPKKDLYVPIPNVKGLDKPSRVDTTQQFAPSSYSKGDIEDIAGLLTKPVRTKAEFNVFMKTMRDDAKKTGNFRDYDRILKARIARIKKGRQTRAKSKEIEALKKLIFMSESVQLFLEFGDRLVAIMTEDRPNQLRGNLRQLFGRVA